MSYARYIWRIWRLKRKVKNLEEERLHSISQKATFRHNFSEFIDKLKPLWWKRYLRRRLSASTITLYEHRRRVPTVLQIFKLASLFLTGLSLSLALYFFAVYYLFIDQTISIYVCSSLGALLSIGLTFSKRLRCITFLAAPQIFTGQGRVVLIAYVLISANNAILNNAVKNVEAYINSTICLQNKLADLLPPPIAKELKVSPYINGSGNALEQRKVSLKASWIKLKSLFKSLDTLYNETWQELQQKYTWLKDKQSFCKKTKSILVLYVSGVIGSLYQHWVVLTLAHWLPHMLRASAKEIIDESFEAICDLDDDGFDLFSLKHILGIRLDSIVTYIKEQVNLNVTFKHKFSYNFSSSKSLKEVRRAVWRDLVKSFSIPQTIISYANIVLNGFMLLIFVKSIIYYRRYSTSVHYDNYYISQQIVELDSRRRFFGLSTILPLRWRERGRFVTTWSIILVGKEKRKLITSVIMILGSALHVGYYMLLDYAIHWIATYLKGFEGLVIEIDEQIFPKINIKGKGVSSEFIRGTIDIFSTFFNYTVPRVDLGECLPKTTEPDIKSYHRIGGLLFGALLIAVLGSWGLRVRHLIAAHYNPDMESSRAIWLHRKITIQRSLRRLTRSRKKKFYLFKHPSQIFPMLLEYLTKTIPLIQTLLEFCGYHREFCSNCGDSASVTNNTYKACHNSGCSGFYCSTCIKVLNNLCVVCERPIEYQLEKTIDINEERDSSDEDFISYEQ
ncbi:hypothetical protein CHUAL_000859 [Chamberlinius hualienensis]